MIKNEYIVEGVTTKIIVKSPTYGKKVVLIDTIDMFLLKNYRVYVWTSPQRVSFYAMLQIEEGKNMRLHRLLLSPKDKDVIDHINGDGLDNRRINIRVTNAIGNNCNARKRKTAKTSNYKGVHFSKRYRKWKAQIQFNKRKISLGTYNTEEEAAHAYNEGALKHHGKYAKLNNLKDAK